MKNLLLILCFGIFIFSESNAQESQSLQINESTVIKDPEGNLVKLPVFIELINSKNWSLEPQTDVNGNAFIQLIKLTEGEKASISAMEERNAEIAGITIPYFEFTDSNGAIISSENTLGKVVVLNFWFTTCPPCIKELPDLNEIYNKYKNRRDVVFAAITFEPQEKVEKFLKKFTLNYPIVSQEGGFSQQMSRGAYPTNIIIGRDGKVSEYISGGAQGIGKEIEAAIQMAL